MHQSDEHMADIVDPASVQGLETYNFSVACARAERYVNTVLEITQKTLTGYRFPNLWILRYGDHSSGEIHNAVARSEFQNQFKNAFAIGQVHALMVRDLSPYFENVFVVCLSGNHGRRTQKKDYQNPHDNWDYAINQTACLLNQDIKNVKYLIPNAWSTVVNIQNHNFAIEHGDDIKSWNSIPYYGLERKTRRLMALNATQNLKVDYFVYGHFHQPSSLGQLADTETLINGSWKATDPYTFGSLSGFTEPSQWLHGVHPEHGITWRFKIKLRSKNEIPERYLIKCQY
jgi:predicted phosphodiesterase